MLCAGKFLLNSSKFKDVKLAHQFSISVEMIMLFLSSFYLYAVLHFCLFTYVELLLYASNKSKLIMLCIFKGFYCYDQNHLKKGFIWLIYPDSQSTERSQGRKSVQEPGGRHCIRSLGGVLPTVLLLLAYSVCFPAHARTTCPWMWSPTSISNQKTSPDFFTVQSDGFNSTDISFS